jgi:hypothetical protein
MAEKELACLVAEIRLEWPAGREATLGMPAGFSRISDAPGLDGVVNLFLNLVEYWKLGVYTCFTRE